MRETQTFEQALAARGSFVAPASGLSMSPLIRTLHLVERMSEQAELYELSCNMDVEAARLAYETMHTRESDSH